MLEALARVARPLILTEAPGGRAATIADLRAAADRAGVAAPFAEPDPDAAVDRAWALGPTAVVAGSLYLAGHVLAALGRI
jgi:folylpolyglutamate synthase/dihydropteroate synthase